MSQSLSRRSFLKCAGSGAVSLAAALLTGVSAAALAPCYQGEPALLDGKAAVELLGYAPAPGLGGALVYLSVENLSPAAVSILTATAASGRTMPTTTGMSAPAVIRKIQQRIPPANGSSTPQQLLQPTAQSIRNAPSAVIR